MSQSITESPRTLGELRDLVNHLIELVGEGTSVQMYHRPLEYEDGFFSGNEVSPLELRFSRYGCIVAPQHMTDDAEDYIQETLFTLEEVEAGMHRQEDEEE